MRKNIHKILKLKRELILCGHSTISACELISTDAVISDSDFSTVGLFLFTSMGMSTMTKNHNCKKLSKKIKFCNFWILRVDWPRCLKFDNNVTITYIVRKDTQDKCFWWMYEIVVYVYILHIYELVFKITPSVILLVAGWIELYNVRWMNHVENVWNLAINCFFTPLNTFIKLWLQSYYSIK